MSTRFFDNWDSLEKSPSKSHTSVSGPKPGALARKLAEYTMPTLKLETTSAEICSCEPSSAPASARTWVRIWVTMSDQLAAKMPVFVAELVRNGMITIWPRAAPSSWDPSRSM